MVAIKEVFAAVYLSAGVIYDAVFTDRHPGRCPCFLCLLEEQEEN